MFTPPAVLWTDDGENKDKPPKGFERFSKDKKPTEQKDDNGKSRH